MFQRSNEKVAAIGGKVLWAEGAVSAKHPRREGSWCCVTGGRVVHLEPLGVAGGDKAQGGVGGQCPTVGGDQITSTRSRQGNRHHSKSKGKPVRSGPGERPGSLSETPSSSCLVVMTVRGVCSQ